MPRRVLVPVLVIAAVLVGVLGWRARHRATPHYTGFVEGEERVIRSEVTGRVRDVAFVEGATVPADAVIATLDDQDITTRITAKRHEIGVLDVDIANQTERIALVESTWDRDRKARRAEVAQAEASAANAVRSFAREQELVKTGASTAQLLDDARARRDEAQSGLTRARELQAKAEAEERNITLARGQLESLKQQRELALAQLAELEVTRAKYTIRAPATATVVQTQFIWPGELAQPGTPILAVLDPTDKYVQVYVPVADVGEFRVGRKVEIELDSAPGRRTPGEVTFVADQANFTPEKIETRSDRLGQVYRAKVRILEDVERFQPGTEGNVYLLPEERPA